MKLGYGGSAAKLLRATFGDAIQDADAIETSQTPTGGTATCWLRSGRRAEAEVSDQWDQSRVTLYAQHGGVVASADMRGLSMPPQSWEAAGAILRMRLERALNRLPLAEWRTALDRLVERGDVGRDDFGGAVHFWQIGTTEPADFELAEIVERELDTRPASEMRPL